MSLFISVAGKIINTSDTRVCVFLTPQLIAEIAALDPRHPHCLAFFDRPAECVDQLQSEMQALQDAATAQVNV